MTFSRTVFAGVLATLVLSGTAFAQTTPAPATPAAPAATTAPAAPAMAMDKKAVSKGCYDEATQQSLHGKARKHFHSKCVRDKMKGM